MIHNQNRTSLKVIALTAVLIFIWVTLTAQAQDLRLRRITISAQETPIASVLTTMANLSGTNIVIATDVSKADDKKEQRVTVSLRDVPLEQALGLVVQSVGLTYRFVGENTFLVGTRERVRNEVGERSYIIPLNNIDAGRVAGSFSSFGGNVSAVEGQNALMVFANPDTYSEIISRIEEMDVPQQQIEIRARLIEVSVNDTQKMGIDWSRINQLTTILAENPSNYDGVGLPWNYSDPTGMLPHGDLYTLKALPETQYFQKIDGFNNVGHFSRQLTAFDITIDWLLENNAAKLLTDTRITALNGQEAEIFIGEVIPFVVMDNDKEVQVEREEVGIKLAVKVSTNKDGLITATIAPEVSSVTDLVGGYVPRTKKRQLNSTVTVPNGRKIIAGGLQNSSLINTTNRVPFLGAIPFIGRLFQHVYTSVQNTDLIIEITPRIVNLAEEQYDFEVDERLGNELIKKKSSENSDDVARN